MTARLRLLLLSLLIGGVSLLPFLWFVLTSFKAPAEITAIPPRLIPSFDWSAYSSAISKYGLLNYMKNSALVAIATTALALVVAAPASYALVRFRLPWGRACLMLFLAVSMFPQIAIAGPVWQILNALELLNTFSGLIAVYVALSLPLAVWILATFFNELPLEIEEAAQVDGFSRRQILTRVVLPMAAPGLFTAAILIFIHAWNEFFFALLIMTNPDRQTLPVGIALFPGEYTMPWGEIAAASTMATLPLIALTLLFQRRIVRGLAAGAVKG
ncbi:MAG TPA: carbohydrate ABC transporter permease [Candidatus Acidoferrales bacterium]|nr:carbohydrate ABC transporter permease [Candidatus Acidoferrales bacterium]